MDRVTLSKDDDQASTNGDTLVAALSRGFEPTPPGNEQDRPTRVQGQQILDQRRDQARERLDAAQAEERRFTREYSGEVPTQDKDREQTEISREVAAARTEFDQADRFSQAGPPPEVGTVIGVHGLYDNAQGTIKEVTDYLTSTGANKEGGVIDFANPGVRELLNGGELTAERIQGMSPQERTQLADRLGINPEGNVFRVQFQSDTDTSAHNAQQLAAATEVALGFTGDSAADVVAHSKGGVDTREYLNNPEERVRSLTTLATPHQGSGLANMASWSGTGGVNASRNQTTPENPAIDELVPGSDFLTELNSNWATQRGRLEGGALTLGGTSDWAVGVDSALVEGATRRTIEDASHSTITHSPSALRTVGEFLGGEELSPNETLAYGIEDPTRVASAGGGLWSALFPPAMASN